MEELLITRSLQDAWQDGGGGPMKEMKARIRGRVAWLGAGPAYFPVWLSGAIELV